MAVMILCTRQGTPRTLRYGAWVAFSVALERLSTTDILHSSATILVTEEKAIAMYVKVRHRYLHNAGNNYGIDKQHWIICFVKCAILICFEIFALQDVASEAICGIPIQFFFLKQIVQAVAI